MHHATPSASLEPIVPSRRTVLGGGAAAVATSAVVTREQSAAAAPGPRRRDDRTKVTSGTDFAVALSPDGRRLAIDLLGVLWVVSSSGGQARRLTSDLYDIAQPDWSPDGRSIAFQSYRDGVFNIWTIRPDGSRLRQLTQGPYDHREPRWSPDGLQIAYSSDEGGSYGIHLLDVRSGRTRLITDSEAEEYEPAWSPDGRRIAFVTAKTRIDVVDVRSGDRRTEVTRPEGEEIHQPSWHPDGKQVVYHRYHEGRNDLMLGDEPLVEGEVAFPFRVAFGERGDYYYTSDGRIRRRRLGGRRGSTVGFAAALPTVTPRYRKQQRDFDGRRPHKVVGIGSPTPSPDGRRIAFRALNDIYVMSLRGRAEPLFRDRWWKADPDFSPDGRRLAFVTDRTGTLNIWIRDLRRDTDEQLTHLTDSAAQSIRWSPDGSEIAYLDQDGALWVADVESGDVQQVFDATFEPGRPSWSPDGRYIALAAVWPYSARYREGLSKILVVDRETGEGRYIDPAPHRSLQTRGDDGPVWSPDGKHLAFAMESVLWVLPVDDTGEPTGSARQVSDELTDAPTWLGDSATLLYLNGDQLRTTSVDGGRTRTIDHDLTWRNAAGPKSLVVHAGSMWDGRSRRVRHDVDIVVRGHRIVAVEPHRSRRHGKVVDASDKFVMPGLIDIHHHREMQGYSYGSRQGPLWLALGITTTRSPGSPAYHMVEERESVQSGRRLGPRYLGTGEAIDGSRVYYNFMRPTFSAGQLSLELERAEALDYDLMKCYVRLPVSWHRKVIRWAHRRGKHVTSHYHYPAIAMGGDQTEHIGATNRFGYSRTVTNVGTAYSDTIRMFNESRMARTPTLFGSSTLYRDDTSLVDDPRVRQLNPPWRMAALDESAREAQEIDQTEERANLAHQVGQLVEMVRGGGLVVAGTDAPIDHVAVSLHMNLRAMVEFGLTPHEALVTATSNSGHFLDEPIGAIARDMYADLTIVDGNPLEDIRDAAAVTGVVVAGQHHTVDELLEHHTSPTTTDESGRTGGAQALATSRVTRERARVPVHPSAEKFWWNAPEELAAARGACCHQH